ncbi:MAG: S9 family peptidase, partial [Blastocatellia bacterium]
MPERMVRPYGSWKSPITSDLIISETVSLGDAHCDGKDIYWIEGRPSEGGRYVIVRRSLDGSTADLTPCPLNARTRVHEYGGGAYMVDRGTVYFSNFADGRLYEQLKGELPHPLTVEGSFRYADIIMDRARKRLISVCEDHSDTTREAVNSIVATRLEAGSRPEILLSGNDFYSNPRLSPDGKTLCWLSWNHPNMPWDGTQLWLADVTDDGSLSSERLIAGSKSESIFQPEWAPDGTLYFVSDRSGWWNIYRLRHPGVEPVTNLEVEFGAPQWVFGTSLYCFAAPNKIFCTFDERGFWRFATIDTDSLRLEKINLPYTEVRGVHACDGKVLFWAGSAMEPVSVALYDLASGKVETLRRTTNVKVDSDYLSLPEAIEFPTSQGLTAFGLFYRPKSRDQKGPAGEKPPLIVISHGGPTGAASSALNLGIQFWTSRGFGVLDVNYGGSTGYGRAYRERLNGAWGVVDVEDCINGARYLAERGEADDKRLIIRGGSAGGYTTLAALTFHDVFKAGASYYGISDIE